MYNICIYLFLMTTYFHILWPQGALKILTVISVGFTYTLCAIACILFVFLYDTLTMNAKATKISLNGKIRNNIFCRCAFVGSLHSMKYSLMYSSSLGISADGTSFIYTQTKTAFFYFKFSYKLICSWWAWGWRGLTVCGPQQYSSWYANPLTVFCWTTKG